MSAHDSHDVQYTVREEKNRSAGGSWPGGAVSRPHTIVVYVVVHFKEMAFVPAAIAMQDSYRKDSQPPKAIFLL
jgi:hypothetical protein